ncbi:hypothetical protein PQQ64_15790 [Paraburkholderia graminis]
MNALTSAQRAVAERSVFLGVTVLTTTGRQLKLTKELLQDGSVRPHSAAKWFAAREVPCATPEQLYSLLLELSDDPHSAIVTEPLRVDLAPNEADRGVKKGMLGGDELATRFRGGCLELRKLGQNFDTKALTRVAMFDVDAWTRAQFDPMGIMGYCTIADRVQIARDWVMQQLPKGYHDVDFVLQMSASAALPQNRDQFKAHIWFILAEPLFPPANRYLNRQYLPPDGWISMSSPKLSYRYRIFSSGTTARTVASDKRVRSVLAMVGVTGL